MDFVTASTGLISPYWMGLPIRYIQLHLQFNLSIVLESELFMKKEIIKINKINKAFRENPVLIDLDFSVYDNDVIYIKGENGCGKSTLLKVICGLLDIDSGSVEIDSNYYIGALIENPEFSDFSSIKENLLFLGNLRSKLNIKELENLCRDFHLNLNDKKLLRNYSIGMKQKMGIIQAIMENQDILIFDEPTRGLDDYSIEVFIKKMKDLIEKGKTIIIASHDFVDIGYSRFITMKSGKLYEETAE